MTWWLWVLAVEYAALGLLALYALAEGARQRAAWKRLALYAHTRHPVANLAPPTPLELRKPEWMSGGS